MSSRLWLMFLLTLGLAQSLVADPINPPLGGGGTIPTPDQVGAVSTGAVIVINGMTQYVGAARYTLESLTNNQTGVTLGLASGSTVANAVLATQPVTLKQLQDAASIYRSWVFWSGSNSTIMTGAKAMRSISEGNPPAGTNVVSVASNGQYIAYCSLPTGMTSLKAGLYQINAVMWRSNVGGDLVSLSAELYVRSTNGTLTEITPVSGTAIQALSSVPLEYIFTLGVVSNTPLDPTDSVVVRFKSGAIAQEPVTVSITSGYFSAPIPSSQYVLNSEAGIVGAGGVTPTIATNIATAVWVASNTAASTPVSLTYASTNTPDCADGLFRKTSLTGNSYLMPPINPTEGMRWEWWITCDGSARTLSLNAAILIPNESGFTSPKTLTASKKYILLLRYNGTAWMLTSLVGGY